MRFILLLVALVYVIRSTEAAFTFVLQVNNHTTSGSCIPRLPVFPSCDTYFSPFCLRESRINRSTNLGDCPLGAYRERRNGTISIQSSAEWKEGFQLFIQALDDNPFSIFSYLDDIFIESSLRDAALSSAMTFTGVQNRVSVTVQFQRTCDANYYGVSCFTYCVPADNDTDGHFTCDASDGSKLCLPGYSNPDNNCQENINDCDSRPCLNGGKCMDLVADFACACPPGYTGKNCSMDIDECQEVYCPGNSTCMDSIDDFTCVCNPGYTGQNCTEAFDPFESDPCVNGGTCVVVDPFSSMCVCPAGYTGPVCEGNIDECLTADCPLGTTCQDGINSFQCLQQSIKLASQPFKVIIGAVMGVVLLLGLGSCILLAVLFMCRRMRHKDKTNPGDNDTLIYDEITHERTLQAFPNVSYVCTVFPNESYGCIKSTRETDLQNGSHTLCERTPCENEDMVLNESASSMTIPTQPNASYGYNIIFESNMYETYHL